MSGGNRARGDETDDPELLQFEQSLERWMNQYDVAYPSESEMMRTIDALRPYVPVKEQPWLSVLKRSAHEMFYFSPMFWLLNGLFFAVGLAAVLTAELNPYATILLLAPLPTLIGLIEAARSRNSGMAELEMSFRYSLQEIILSKMVVVGGFNVAINGIAIGIITVFLDDVWIWKLMLCWVAPFTAIMAIALAAATKLRHGYGVTAGLAVWIGFGGWMSQAHAAEQLERVPVPVYLLVTLIAGSIAMVRFIQLNRKEAAYEFTD